MKLSTTKTHSIKSVRKFKIQNKTTFVWFFDWIYSGCHINWLEFTRQQQFFYRHIQRQQDIFLNRRGDNYSTTSIQGSCSLFSEWAWDQGVLWCNTSILKTIHVTKNSPNRIIRPVLLWVRRIGLGLEDGRTTKEISPWTIKTSAISIFTL